MRVRVCVRLVLFILKKNLVLLIFLFFLVYLNTTCVFYNNTHVAGHFYVTTVSNTLGFAFYVWHLFFTCEMFTAWWW